MIFSNVFITREVSAIGRKSLGSFGLSFSGIGNTVESLNITDLRMEVYGGLEEALKDATKLFGTKSESSATNPIGTWAFIYTCMLEQHHHSVLVNDSTVSRHQGRSHIGNVWWTIMCFETSEETVHVVWQCLISHPLQTNPWPWPMRSRRLVDICHVLMPCQAARRQPPLNFDSIFFLYFSFAFIIVPNFPVHLFLLICCTLKKDPLLLVQKPLQISCSPRFVVLDNSDMFRGYHRFNTKWNIRRNDVSSLKLVHIWSNISQSVQSKHPFKQATLSWVQSFTVFTTRCTHWMTGLYTGPEAHCCGRLIQREVMQGTSTRQANCLMETSRSGDLLMECFQSFIRRTKVKVPTYDVFEYEEILNPVYECYL